MLRIGVLSVRTAARGRLCPPPFRGREKCNAVILPLKGGGMRRGSNLLATYNVTSEQDSAITNGKVAIF
jgi:hypothetical protein